MTEFEEKLQKRVSEIRAKIKAFDEEVEDTLVSTSDLRQKVEAFVEQELKGKREKQTLSFTE